MKHKFEKMKFEVWNEDHSRAIQEELFKLGYRWFRGGSTLSYFYACYLFVDESGYISCVQGGSQYFNGHPGRLSCLAELRQLNEKLEKQEEKQRLLGWREVNSGRMVIASEDEMKEFYNNLFPQDFERVPHLDEPEE